jgi:hypothetical protein
MKQCSVADTKTPEFGVLGGVFFKLDILWTGRKLLFFGSVSGCTCLILKT